MGRLGGQLGPTFKESWLFFSLSFLTWISHRFFLVLEGFWEVFRRPKRPTNQYFGCFREYAFPDLIFDRFLRDKKKMEPTSEEIAQPQSLPSSLCSSPLESSAVYYDEDSECTSEIKA